MLAFGQDFDGGSLAQAFMLARPQAVFVALQALIHNGRSGDLLSDWFSSTHFNGYLRQVKQARCTKINNSTGSRKTVYNAASLHQFPTSGR
jgi:hypothetical protein